MSIPLISITCTAYNQIGLPFPGVLFTFILNNVEEYSGIVIPKISTVTTNSSGIATLALFSAGSTKYTVTGSSPTGELFLRGVAVIPSVAANLQDILTVESYSSFSG